MKDFCVSDEAIEEFRKLEHEDYPLEIWEKEYNNWYERLTDPLPNGEREKYITKMIRLRVPDYSNPDEITYREYIIHDFSVRRITKIGNYESRYIPKIGVYPRVRPVYRLVYDQETGGKKKVYENFEVYDTVYTLPFSEKLAMDLYRKYCDRRTELLLKDGDHLSTKNRQMIKSIEDFRAEDQFDNLVFFGHVPTKDELEDKEQEEKRRLKDQRKAAAEQMKQRMATDSRVPSPPRSSFLP